MPDPKRMCRTCRWLIKLTERSRIYTYLTYPCNCPLPPLPDSVTKTLFRARVRPTDGETCPTWEKRDA
jgi:hypothetical protein